MQRLVISFIQQRLGSHKLFPISPAINDQTQRALTENKTGVVTEVLTGVLIGFLTENKTGVVIEVLTGVLTGAVMLALSLLAHVVMNG